MTPDVSNLSILGWILNEKIVTEKGEPLDFHDHAFLLDILTDWSQNIAVKACSQVGKSVTFNLKALFAVRTFGWNIIYTMPTDDDVREFVGTKTNKILQENPQTFAGIQTDNIERKEINGRFLFFKGTVSKSAAISTTADLLIHDEASRSDQKQLNTYKSRTKDSPFKGRWLFSNPTTEKDLLDQEWKKSDQKEWHVTCPACELEQQLVWPDNIDIERKCFQCSGCKAEMSNDTRRKGRWIAMNPGAKVSGYHLSHLIATRITAAEIIEDSEGDQEYFHNFVLGEPYNPGDLTVTRSTILDNWTPKSLDTGTYYLGVDIGNIKHYVLGSEKGVIKVGRFSKWSDLDDMLIHYRPTCAVIDAMPDNTMAKHFVEHYRNVLMSFFQDNTNNPQVIVWWGEGDKKGIVYSNRNRALDQMLDYIIQAKMLFALASDNELREYIKHFETLRRVKVVNPKGIESYEWQSTTGVDHYVFATLYYYLAMLSQGTGAVIVPQNPAATPLVKSGVSGDFLNLKEILDERDAA
jgi:hypothetical protein